MSPTDRQIKRIRRRRIRKVMRTVADRRALKECLLAAQDNRCMYCCSELTLETATFEHLRPRSKGGPFVRTNLRLACADCNQRRGNRPIAEFLQECICEQELPIEVRERLIDWLEELCVARS